MTQLLRPDYAPSGADATFDPPPEPFAADAAGIVVVDKPLGLTSQQVVSRLRRIFGLRKIGHAGTLDPQASGVLVCALGRATRLISVLQGAPKSYRARVVFGMTTSTEDAAGEVTSMAGAHVEQVAGALDAALGHWRGEIDQRPSSVSAIKIAGRRAYARVRAGEDVRLPARRVTISALDLVEGPTAAHRDGVDVVECDIAVTCSAGTYIRALARDLGEEMGCGAHLSALRRVEASGVSCRDAHTLDAIAEEVRATSVTASTCVQPAGPMLARLLPVIVLDDNEYDAVALGRGVRIDAERVRPPQGDTRGFDGDQVVLVDSSGRVAGLARPSGQGSQVWVKPHVVLATARRR